MSNWEVLKLRKVRNVRIIPVTLKIVIVFTLFIMASNLTTNYISLVFNRVQQIGFSKQLLIKDLKELSNFCNIQWQIMQLNNDEAGALDNITRKSQFELASKGSVFLGLRPNGEIRFHSLELPAKNILLDPLALQEMRSNLANDREEDFIVTTINNVEYFGIYKYNNQWDMFLFRGEESTVFFEDSWQSFQRVLLIIILITIASIISGIFIVRYILRFIGIITNAIMQMSKSQQLTAIPLEKAPNDDVTYMGMAFNSLSNNIDTLMNIFKKFTDRDIVARAYEKKNIKLEGQQKELAILFTDIKGYTFITEVLGADIIKLINLQYQQAIDEIDKYEGIIASIIGDALLAVYGVMPAEKQQNKSYNAVMSGYALVKVTNELQTSMIEKRKEITLRKGELTVEEERIYQAVLLEIGVGIDGGNVFYGTIGSHLRMTSTVIGDQVNAASRLEALTRIYKVPIICSEYIRDDVINNVENPDFTFINIDTVQVQGKTEGIAIYWPVHRHSIDESFAKELKAFEEALELFYQGDWQAAHALFKQCNLPIAEEFVMRTLEQSPNDWKGIWVLTSK
jgi:class 3 adenylate cyclase